MNANPGLKELPVGISQYFGHIPNYLQIEGNFTKIQSTIEILVNHKGRRMVKGATSRYFELFLPLTKLSLN